MTAWPETLPTNFLDEGFRDEEIENTIMFESEVGPPLLRRKMSLGAKKLSGSMVLTRTQKGTLRTFYRSYGSSEFTFPDPDTGSNITVIFIKPPSFEPAGGIKHKVNLELREMP